MRPTTLLCALILMVTGLVGAPAVRADGVETDSARANTGSAVLLVTSKELAPAWQAFADWKTRLGKRTTIMTVEAVETAYEGADIQQKLRACVLDYIENHNVFWVILGGDSQPDGAGHVPDRDTPHLQYGERQLPTDVYYISTEDWDANDDGTYGDFSEDREAIRYTHPKACIARIPLRTKADVEAYTEKVIAYESKYPTTGNFHSQLLYTCPERHAEPKLLRSWDDHVGKSWEDGEVLRWFAGVSPWDGDEAGDFDLTPGNWKQQLEAGVAGKIHMHGHGFLPAWVLENHTTVDVKFVKRLSNEGLYPIMTTVSCWTGHFDAEDDPSIVEQMLRQPKGGTVATIAPSRPGVPVFHKRSDMRLMMTEGKLDGTTEMLTLFWVHGLGKDLTTGEAFAAAKTDMADDAEKTAGFHWIQCELNLLGDPTLDMRAHRPKTPRLTAPETIQTGPVAVHVETDTPGATVCVWKGDEVYAVQTTGEDGSATFQVTPATSGEMLVTVSGPSLNAALGRIRVDAPK